jgi:hypothetical protein
MFSQSTIIVDPCVAEEVIKLYKDLDNARGGAYGTWHSRRIRTNPHPWFEDTFNRVATAVGDLTIDEWWFNCGEPLDEYRWHTHSPYKWAGVLYIQTPENSGGIEFRQQEEYYTHTPQAGEFLLFSGNLAHRVLKNNSTDYRISVAFNFKR